MTCPGHTVRKWLVAHPVLHGRCFQDDSLGTFLCSYLPGFWWLLRLQRNFQGPKAGIPHQRRPNPGLWKCSRTPEGHRGREHLAGGTPFPAPSRGNYPNAVSGSPGPKGGQAATGFGVRMAWRGLHPWSHVVSPHRNVL